MSSGSMDRPLYASGQRGSYTAALPDRSSSFRENMENPNLSALPSMSRNTAAVTQSDVVSFLQCLRFDPKAIIGNNKLNQQGDYKRFAGLALGVPSDGSPFNSSKGILSSLSHDEVKRLRLGLRESTIKARERMKIFSEGLLVINKCFPNIPSRKRSRSDVLTGERPNSFLSSHCSLLAAAGGKIGAQRQSSESGYELEQQKPDERTRNGIINKRTRTSVVDPKVGVRPNTPGRTYGNADGDKEGLRLTNDNAAQGEDRILPIVDSWEKSKMKKKRSGIKTDIAPSSLATNPTNGLREPKQGMQPRLLSDSRSRLNDSFGCRPGGANGIVVVKADGTSQQTSSGMHSSITKSDQDSNVLHVRRGRATNLDKERPHSRAVNKPSTQEEFSSASPSSSAKISVASQAPQSGSAVIPKVSPVVQRETGANDWDISHCTSKNPATVGANNCKRTPRHSSSPPVAQWSKQRPQKMSRSARRSNFAHIVSSDYDASPSDTLSDVVNNENCIGFMRRPSGNSSQQVKLKGDYFLSSALSESEESMAAEVKSRAHGKTSDGLDDKSGQTVQKLTPVILPTRKNKVGSREGFRDGIRRQGRTGRGLTSPRSFMPTTVEKHRNTGNAKQLRSAKLGFDKTESKAGRPVSRKLSDGKAYIRQKHTTLNSAADFLVGSDDGHEELLAAANAVTNPSFAFSSSFWRPMEPLFGSISDVDMAYLKQQGNLGPSAATPNTETLDSMLCDEIGSIKGGQDMSETLYARSPRIVASGTGVYNEISLCQMLLAALISEDVNEEACCSGYEEQQSSMYESECKVVGDIESDGFSQQSVQSFELSGSASVTGYRMTVSERSHNELEYNPSDMDILSGSDAGITSGFDDFQNGFLPEQAVVPTFSCSGFQYKKMSLNERALLEIQSIGLSPEAVPGLTQTGDEEIDRDISRLDVKYHEQVCRKKDLINKLLKSTSAAKEQQEKEFELSALDNLVGMAYQKYMSCWGPNASGGKSASSKVAKQAALSFVKRTLERCQQFELTGESCFSKPLFREMLHSRLSQSSQGITGSTDGESGKFYINSAGCSFGGRGIQQSPSVKKHVDYSPGAILSVNNSSEKINGKEDTWSNRVKKRELLLDDVIGGVVGGTGTSLSSSAKGRRGERDREGMGNNREMLSRNGTTKIGRTSDSVKGERKSKSKPKQKTTQLSAVTGLVAKRSESLNKVLSPKPKLREITSNGNRKLKDSFNLDILENSEAVDLSNLHIDAIDVPDDLGNKGEDIGSWLNIDDDGLQDHDCMGLEIPMDDLSELNMMV